MRDLLIHIGILHPELGDSRFLRNVDMFLPDFATSQNRTQQYSFLHPLSLGPYYTEASRMCTSVFTQISVLFLFLIFTITNSHFIDAAKNNLKVLPHNSVINIPYTFQMPSLQFRQTYCL